MHSPPPNLKTWLRAWTSHQSRYEVKQTGSNWRSSSTLFNDANDLSRKSASAPVSRQTNEWRSKMRTKHCKDHSWYVSNTSVHGVRQIAVSDKPLALPNQWLSKGRLVPFERRVPSITVISLDCRRKSILPMVSLPWGSHHDFCFSAQTNSSMDRAYNGKYRSLRLSAGTHSFESGVWNLWPCGHLMRPVSVWPFNAARARVRKFITSAKHNTAPKRNSTIRRYSDSKSRKAFCVRHSFLSVIFLQVRILAWNWLFFIPRFTRSVIVNGSHTPALSNKDIEIFYSDQWSANVRYEPPFQL